MNTLLILLGVLAAAGFVCGAIAAATGGNTPPPPDRRTPLDDELDQLLDSEGDGRG